MKLLTPSLAVIGGTTWLLASCSDNINSYSSTIAPVDEVVYYISGTVYDNFGNTLRDVDVKSNGKEVETDAQGVYILPVKKSGNHTVTFEEDGYLKQSVQISIPSNAGIFSEVPLSITLSPISTVEITPSAADTTFIVASNNGTLAEAGTDPGSNAPTNESAIGLEIPANATDKKLRVSYYTYPTGVMTAQPGNSEIALGAVNITPDVDSFQDGKKVKINISNPIPGTYFSNLALINVGKSEKIQTPYNAATNEYATEITHFSDWAFLVPVQTTFTSGEEVKYIDTDNSGNTQTLRDKEIKYSFTNGWEVTDCSDPAMKDVLTRLITNYKGFKSGVVNRARTEKVNVTAGGILRFTYTQNYRTEVYTFTFANNSNVTLTVKQYLDLTTSFLYVGHSGGSGE